MTMGVPRKSLKQCLQPLRLRWNRMKQEGYWKMTLFKKEKKYKKPPKPKHKHLHLQLFLKLPLLITLPVMSLIL